MDWSLELADLIVTTEWECSKCHGIFCLTGIQKLQHIGGKQRICYSCSKKILKSVEINSLFFYVQNAKII